jgi:dipeptidyl-peptidase-4
MTRAALARRIPAAFAAALLALAMAPNPQTPPDPSPGFLEQYAATLRFTLGTPQAIRVVAGGNAVLFLRSPSRSLVLDLYELDMKTGEERRLASADRLLGGGEENLSAEEKARRERTRGCWCPSRAASS